MTGPKKAEPFLDRDIREAEDFRLRQRERVTGTHELLPIRRPHIPARPKKRSHLVVGDAHAHPDESNFRFQALGNFIAHHASEIDHVILMGDFSDLACLLGYEAGMKGPLFDGRRYWQDVDCGVDALQRAVEPLKGKRKRPKLWGLEGNHENRVSRLLEVEPRWRGVIGYPGDFLLEELGVEHVPFLETVAIDGIQYCHFWKQPGSQRALSSETLGRAAILKYPSSQSRVCGHSHRFEVYEAAGTADNRKISSLVAGCYFDPASSSHRWARTDVHRWRAGLLWREVEDEQIAGFRWWDFWDILRGWG